MHCSLYVNSNKFINNKNPQIYKNLGIILYIVIKYKYFLMVPQWSVMLLIDNLMI